MQKTFESFRHGGPTHSTCDECWGTEDATRPKQQAGTHEYKTCTVCRMQKTFEPFRHCGPTHSKCDECWEAEGSKKTTSCGIAKPVGNFTKCGASHSTCDECHKPRTLGKLKCGRGGERKDRTHYTKEAPGANTKARRCDACVTQFEEEQRAIAASNLRNI